MINQWVAFVWLLVTVGLYVVMKLLYTRHRKWWLMPMVSVPLIIVASIILLNAAYINYYADTRWLVWMLGPATVAFAVPIYEKRKIIYQNWVLLSIGVLTGIVVSISSSIFLSKLFLLTPELQASLVTRSISTPFALMVAPKIGGIPDLAAVFVIVTGVFGMIVGQFMLALLPVKSRVAKGALFGAASHACGTAKAMEIHQEVGVVSSLVMILSGIATVFAYPLIAYLLH